MGVARIAPSLSNLRESIASFTALPSAFGVSVILQFSIELFDLFYIKFTVIPLGQTEKGLAQAVAPDRLLLSSRLVM